MVIVRALIMYNNGNNKRTKYIKDSYTNCKPIHVSAKHVAFLRDKT